MEKVKKVLKWITNILTGILLVILVILIYTKCITTFSRSTYPNYFGYTILEVASGSMEPTLNIHDVVLVKIENNDIKENDIVAYVEKDSIITHRVLFVDNDNLTLKGDANNTIDDVVKRSNIIGKVVKIYKELGIWKSILMEPKIIITLFVTLILFDIALSCQGKKDKKEDSKEEVQIKKIKDMSQEEKERMLEFTRKIDIEEINELLKKDEIKLSKEEVKNLKENLTKMDEGNKLELPKLKEKEKKFLEYTMRLDLNEIQKRIQEKVK